MLEDFLWGQYCLYLAVCIKDDLFDRQASAKYLSIAADQFKAESRKIFGCYFDKGSPFWRDYLLCTARTNIAIKRIDALQRQPKTRPRELLPLFAEQSSVFKVGSAAVCRSSDRHGAYDRISRFADQMAIAAQIIDDLEDMAEDFEQKRLNYAASVMLREERIVTQNRSDTLRKIAEGILYGNGLKRLFAEVRAHVGKAEKAIRDLRFPEARTYFKSYRSILSEIEGHYYAERVRWLLGT